MGLNFYSSVEDKDTHGYTCPGGNDQQIHHIKHPFFSFLRKIMPSKARRDFEVSQSFTEVGPNGCTEQILARFSPQRFKYPPKLHGGSMFSFLCQLGVLKSDTSYLYWEVSS